MAMVDGLGMDVQETKVAMPPHEMLNSWHCVTFGTHVAWYIRKCWA
jgi:hypothetical protein